MKLRLFFQAISDISHNVKPFQLPFKYTFTVRISTLILLEKTSGSIIHRYRFDRHNQILSFYSIRSDILHGRSTYLSRYQRQILGTIPSLLDSVVHKVIPHFTRPGYDIPRLERCIDRIQQRNGLQVYLEPGEAVALNAGILRCTVLDIVENGGKIAILDTSAACHMPDVLEMPYRPPLRGSGLPGEKAYSYRLGGPTCLAGDIIGDYSFDRPLAVGDVLEFGDMAIYSMVKNNTFNGMPLPSIALRTLDGTERCIRSFGYEDFKQRLS